MSRIAKAVGQIAGAVALVAGVALLFVPGGQILGVGLLTIATVASAVSAVAMTVAQATAKPPDMKGSVNQIIIGKNLPVPYCMGRSYSGGAEVYDDSTGDKNKYRTKIVVDTVAGPINGYETFLTDYQSSGMVPSGGNFASNSTGWYADFLFCGTRKGLRPDTALTSYSGHPALRNWTSAHKLSGIAAAAITMKFDKDGKRFSGGIPQMGRVAKWVLTYDPRLDSTYTGGSGSHRWDDEATWSWSENPSLHALAYARGRFVNGVKVAGAGITKGAINLARFVELANLCEANGWTIGGTIYEGPGISRWDNLLRILAVAAAKPVWIGGALDLKFASPKVALATITSDDVIGDIEISAMTSWKERFNTIIPRVRSEAHKWEYIQLDEVKSTVYLAEDGEPKTTEQQWDLCQDKDQGAELTAYMLANGREFPMTLTAKPRFMSFRPGECLEVNIPGLIHQLFTISSREVNPATGEVTFTLESETTAKHAFALGRTGVAPPTPSLWTPQLVDEIAADATVTTAMTTQLIADSSARGLDLSIATTGAVTVSTHERVYADKFVSVTGATVTPSPAAVAGDRVGVFYDDPDRAGGAVTYQYDRLAGGAGEIDHMFASADHPFRHFITLLTVPTTGTTSGGSGAGPGTGGTGGGVGGGGYSERVSTL